MKYYELQQFGGAASGGGSSYGGGGGAAAAGAAVGGGADVVVKSYERLFNIQNIMEQLENLHTMNNKLTQELNMLVDTQKVSSKSTESGFRDIGQAYVSLVENKEELKKLEEKLEEKKLEHSKIQTEIEGMFNTTELNDAFIEKVKKDFEHVIAHVIAQNLPESVLNSARYAQDLFLEDVEKLQIEIAKENTAKEESNEKRWAARSIDTQKQHIRDALMSFEHFKRDNGL
jgi:hypothetical protein